MENLEQLKKHGLFDARVPRYTSYPPANHFAANEGRKNQSDWLRTVRDGADVSIYIHIPFCKRLCYFCACRTQGTQTMRPVDAYVEILKKELRMVRGTLPDRVRMTRLHLGGGTPTILSPDTMKGLLRAVFGAFETSSEFEFSVEIDPTQAADELLTTLAAFGLNRASIGVQDFAPEVQQVIGRVQTFEQTERVVQTLCDLGVDTINLDLLYGLPRQTMQSFEATLQKVCALRPDRLAIYGYAHVPWMSKRQVMIKDDMLGDGFERFALATLAKTTFVAEGYAEVGIDHFALPSDGLAKAAKAGILRRNFQGYTDDPAQTLLGLGASAISKFAAGFSQNAVATSAYQERIQKNGLAGHKGYHLAMQDLLIGAVIEDLMCHFLFREKRLQAQFPDQKADIRNIAAALMRKFPDLFYISSEGLKLRDAARPLVRIIASHADGFLSKDLAHATAI